MPLPLPNLDDRRWVDLAEEGRALIPLYARGWTDHNPSDPGVTVMELLAAVAEMDVFELDQVTDRHRREFLSLVGFSPRPPRPARTVVALTLPAGSASVFLPAGLVCEGSDPFHATVGFRTQFDVTVIGSELTAVQVSNGRAIHDVTQRWKAKQRFNLFGDDPRPDCALYLGFGGALPAGDEVSLWFSVQDPVADADERERLAREAAEQAAACTGPDPAEWCVDKPCTAPSAWAPSQPCGGTIVPDPSVVEVPTDLEASAAPPLHHSVRTVWEFATAGGTWRQLDPAFGEVWDDTRAFTLNGRVTLRIPATATRVVGGVAQALRYVRCRFASGQYDAAPELLALAMNAVPAVQAVLPSAATELLAASPTGFVEHLGIGTDLPWQQVTVSAPAVVESTFALFTEEPEPDGTTILRRWQLREDFDASGRADRHFVLDATTGTAAFGDGDKGRTVPAGARIIAGYLATRAEAGNVAAGTVARLSMSHHDAALFAGGRSALEDADTKLHTVTNPVPAVGGTAAETVEAAGVRARANVNLARRAVTLSDIADLIVGQPGMTPGAPGIRVARVHALPNVHPAFPCLHAPGIITVVALPHLPPARPSPSPALRQRIAGYLNRRRVIGTRFEVVGPEYREVAVLAKVQARAGAGLARVSRDVANALDSFFHPLTGGPDRRGWPLGRDVYRSEVLQVIDETDGVDHVLALELQADGSEADCGNVCLGRLGLVAAGAHRIEVVA